MTAPIRPSPVLPLLVLLLIGAAVAILLQSAPPRGSIRGTIALRHAGGKPLAGCDIYLTPEDEPDAAPEPGASFSVLRRSRRVAARPDGSFEIRGVLAGKYYLSASAAHHESATLSVDVADGKTLRRNLVLKRTESGLALGAHQATFGSEEAPFLPVSGYLDFPTATKPAPEQLRIRVWRTRLSDLLRREGVSELLDRLSRNRWNPITRMPPALLQSAPGIPAPTLIGETTHRIRNADREGFFFNRVPLPGTAGKPGLYLVEFTYNKVSVSGSVLVSDMALVSKRVDTDLLAYAVDIKTGKPLDGATVRFYRDNHPEAVASTNREGIARLSLPPRSMVNNGAGGESPPAEKNPLLVGYRGNDEAVVSGAGWWYGSEARAYVVHIVTDRTIYRPGDTIAYKGIVRQRRSGDFVDGYEVPRNVPVTVEVRAPDGTLITRTNTTTSARGTFSGNIETSSEGATGSYSLVTTVDGQESLHDIPVASYRKPDYTVTVTPDKTRYRRGDAVEMTIAGKYYFGTPVVGATVRYQVYADADWFREYTLANPNFDPEADLGENDRHYGSYYGRWVTNGTTTLDANGKATIRFSTRPEHGDGGSSDEDELSPQVENFTLTATVEDDSKRSVEAEGVAVVSAADVVLSVEPEGYLASPGQGTRIFVTARDFDGKPLSGYRVHLKGEYRERNSQTRERAKAALPGLRPAITDAVGRAVFTLTPPQAGELILNASTSDTGGHSTRDTAYLWVAADNGSDLNTDAGDLTLLTDKNRYEPGATARILINTARVGQSVLLTVEGDRIYETRTLPIRRASTVVTLPIRKEWGANVTLAACFIRGKKFASSESPLRIQRREREITVTVRPDRETTQPGEALTYSVATSDAATGKPVSADFSLAVVDEALFALQADDPKALKRTFYPQRSNRVNTQYSFMVEYLGNATKSAPEIEARRKFRDTAFWQPNLRTDETGQAKVTVSLPDNLTTWRATVQAITDRTAAGYGVAKTIARKPFFVRLETPRYLTVGDQTRLLVLAHNDTGISQQVSVRLNAIDVGNRLRFGTGEMQTITVPAGGVGQAVWPVTVTAPGEAQLRITAWTDSGNRQPFTDGVETTLTLRAYGRTRVHNAAGAIGGPGKNQAREAQTSGLPTVSPGQIPLTLDTDAVPEETRLTVRITPSVRGALVGSLEYLIGFPYGCTEQTMSRFYPDLLAQRLRLPVTPEQQKNLPRMVRDGLARLRKLQKADTGGWGWFEQGPDDAFLTAYVLVGLAEARRNGYPIEDTLLATGRKAGLKMLDTAPPRLKPFLLYALAEAGETDKKRLQYPFRYSVVRTGLELDKLPPDALAYLVLLARRLGEDPAPAWNALQRRAVIEGRTIHWTAKGQWDEFGSDRMATAAALRAMLAMNPQDTRIPLVLRWLMASRTDSYFGNTRDTSWVLTAFCDYLAVHPEDAVAPQGQIRVLVNGTTVQTVNLARQTEPELALSLPTDRLKTGNNSLEIRPTGVPGTVFYSASLRQTVATSAQQALPELAPLGVTVKREILRVVPRSVRDAGWRLGVEDTKGRFQPGDQLRVRLTINVNKSVNPSASYVLIEDRFPSNCEISQRGTEDEVIASWGYWYDQVTIRDDRIAFFARHLPAGTHTIEYNLRAQTPGRSAALPTHLEGMYDDRLRAESPSTWIAVTR